MKLLHHISALILFLSLNLVTATNGGTFRKGQATFVSPSRATKLCPSTIDKDYGNTLKSPSPSIQNRNKDHNCVLSAKKKGGYQFGDITTGLINSITGESDYKFGDLSKHLDQQAKARIAELHNKTTYEVGDLSRYLDQTAKQKLSEWTEKERYEFGDVTKTILRKVTERDYDFSDLVLLIKTLVSFGAGMSSVSGFLPMKLLIDLLNYSIVGDLGQKVVSAIAEEIDKRMKYALTGDANYAVGDLTKREILKYVGKEKDGQYEFGDITKTVLSDYEARKKPSAADGISRSNQMESEYSSIIDVDAIEVDEDGRSIIKPFLGELSTEIRKDFAILDTKIILNDEKTASNN